jgi:hypothetical protein
MNDYELAIKYLKVCFDQSKRLSGNEKIYDDKNHSVPVSEIEDFLVTLNLD